MAEATRKRIRPTIVNKASFAQDKWATRRKRKKVFKVG